MLKDMSEYMYGESWSVVEKPADEGLEQRDLLRRLTRCLDIQRRRDLNHPYDCSSGSLTPDEQRRLLNKAIYNFYQEARGIDPETYAKARKLINSDPTP